MHCSAERGEAANGATRGRTHNSTLCVVSHGAVGLHEEDPMLPVSMDQIAQLPVLHSCRLCCTANKFSRQIDEHDCVRHLPGLHIAV